MCLSLHLFLSFLTFLSKAGTVHLEANFTFSALLKDTPETTVSILNVPVTGAEPGPPGCKPGILNARLYGNLLLCINKITEC